jgi:hypothetical protein
MVADGAAGGYPSEVRDALKKILRRNRGGCAIAEEEIGRRPVKFLLESQELRGKAIDIFLMARGGIRLFDGGWRASAYEAPARQRA